MTGRDAVARARARSYPVTLTGAQIAALFAAMTSWDAEHEGLSAVEWTRDAAIDDRNLRAAHRRLQAALGGRRVVR